MAFPAVCGCSLATFSYATFSCRMHAYDFYGICSVLRCKKTCKVVYYLTSVEYFEICLVSMSSRRRKAVPPGNDDDLKRRRAGNRKKTGYGGFLNLLARDSDGFLLVYDNVVCFVAYASENGSSGVVLNQASVSMKDNLFSAEGVTLGGSFPPSQNARCIDAAVAQNGAMTRNVLDCMLISDGAIGNKSALPCVDSDVDNNALDVGNGVEKKHFEEVAAIDSQPSCSAVVDPSQRMLRGVGGLLGTFAPAVDVPNFSLGTQVDNLGNEDKNSPSSSKGQKTKVSKNGGFRDLDPELLEKVNSVGEPGSKGKNDWARGRFDSWRDHVGLDCSIPIEELGVYEFADMLERFFLCLQHIDGSRYPPESLKAVFRSLNNIIQHHQEVRIMKTRQQEIQICMFKDIAFIKARKALEVAIQDSAAAGKIGKRNKPDILSLIDQEKILNHPSHQITVATGLQKRFSFYCMSRFLVRGGKELANLRDFMFVEGKDLVREYLEYCETNSKNWKTTLNKCKIEDFREPFRCYDPDVLLTWRTLLFHLPDYAVEDKIGGRFVFLQAIVGNPRTDAWYNRHHVSQKTISGWLKNMVDKCGMEGNYTNKSLRATAITQMQVNHVPLEVGMSMTGHRSVEGYKRYDQSGVVSKAAAMEVLSSGKEYKEAFKDNVQKLSNCLSGLRSDDGVLADITNLKVGNSAVCGPATGLNSATTSVSAVSKNSPVIPIIQVDEELLEDVDRTISEYNLENNKLIDSVDKAIELYTKEKLTGVCSVESSSSARGISSGKITFSGNRIEKFILNVVNVADAAALLKSLQ